MRKSTKLLTVLLTLVLSLSVVCIFAFAASTETESGDTVNITWRTPDNNSVTEAWPKSADVIPTRAVNAQASDVYYYEWCDEEGNAISSTASGDKTYVLTPRMKFTLKANVTLYTDFVYNIYVPKWVVDSASFKSIQFLEVATGETVAPVPNGTKTIEGVVHNVYSKPIDATEGDAEYKFVITFNGDYGDIVKEQAFSIPDYVQRVLDGNYSAKADAMVTSTLTYIKAARNYYASADEAEIPYKDLTVNAAAKKWDKATPSETVKDAIYGINVSPDSRFKFVLYIYADKINTVEIMCRENGKFVALSDIGKNCQDNHEIHQIYDEEKEAYVDVLCQEISLTALDVRSPIRINITTTTDINPDYSYSLANYVYSVYGKENPYLDKLLDALWAYSESCEAYVTDENSSDTPAVEISIGGKTVNEDNYVIVAANEAEKAAAEKLQAAIAAKTGKTLAIENASVSGKSSILVNLSDEPTADYDFVAEVSGYDLVFNCSLPSHLDGSIITFITKHISPLNANKTFASSFNESYYTDSVYYSDFGAVGDGKTDDFLAIYNTHEFANDTGKTVKADSKDTYYICDTRIGSKATTVTIQTDVDWCGANFIIDDTSLVAKRELNNLLGYEEYRYMMGQSHIFTVTPNDEHQKVTITNSDILASLNIGPNTEEIGNVIHEAIGGWDGPLMIIPYNSGHKVFRRNATGDGSEMQETIVIEADGSISSETPIIFNYTTVTKVEVYKLDPLSAVTVKNGTFTTLETKVNHLVDGTRYGGYILRGLMVRRSYTTVENVEHVVKYGFNLKDRAAGYEGASQSGLFRAEYANHVTFKDCVIPGRMAYGNSSSYSFGAKHVNKMVLDNCFQPNFWVTTAANGEIYNATVRQDGAIGNAVKSGANAIEGMGYNDLGLVTAYDAKPISLFWGAGQSNFCKNMEYLNSTIARFDAHQGLHTGKVINSNVMGFEIIGYGEMLIEDSAIYNYSSLPAGNSLIYLRGDYGSTWDGDIILKNVKAYPYDTSTDGIVYHGYTNGDFGYTCHFPNIVLDNVTYWDRATGARLTANERGPVRLIVLYRSNQYSFLGEPNLHLDTLSDGTTNVNKIVPPDYISVINNSNGYNYKDIYTTYENTYTSKGINSFFKDTVIGINSGDTTSFVNNEKTFTVTWVDGDGKTLETDSVLYGTTPEYNGTTPTKTPTDEHSYAFADCWDSEISFVRGDVTYTAQFVETNVTHTVTWVDEDGTVLETDENVLHGAMPEYNGETPTKEADAQYTYTFKGWTPTVSAVTGDKTYTATFTEALRSYTVTYYSEDGSAVLYTETVEYGFAAPEHTATKETDEYYSYDFDKWVTEQGGSVEAVLSNITGNVNVYASFEKTERKATVTIASSDVAYGSVSASEIVVPYGAIITVSGNTLTVNGETVTATVTDANDTYTYVFNGWYINGTKADGTITVDETVVVDGNIEITAEFLREKTIINVTDEKDEDAPVVPYV